MLAVIPILLLILTPLVMLGIRLRRPGFAYFWLFAAFGSLLVWPLILLARLRIPLVVPLVIWGAETVFPISPALLLDEISWPFALALATLNLGTVLTDVARAANSDKPRSSWIELASYMAITAASLLAVVSGNLLTLLLAWVTLDLLELALWLIQARNSDRSVQVVIAFAFRAAGLILAIWAATVAHASGLSLSFTTITSLISPYLLIAAGLRLGVLPVSTPLPKDLSLQRSAQVMLRLAPQAANLLLLARAASTGVSPALAPVLLILTGLAAFYGSLSWLSASDELDGLPFWTLGLGALALACAVRAQPAASLTWGIALLLPGGLLFLFSARPRWLLPLLLIGALSLSSLPFTPTWNGVRLYAAPLQGITLILLVAQGVSLAGYLRHALRPAPALISAERWVWLIYPWGLALLPLTHFVIDWWSRSAAGAALQALPSLLESWPAAIALLPAILVVFWLRTERQVPAVLKRMLVALSKALSTEWLYRLLGRAYRASSRLFTLVNTVLEGEAGILWALLILSLLLSLFLQAGLGG